MITRNEATAIALKPLLSSRSLFKRRSSLLTPNQSSTTSNCNLKNERDSKVGKMKQFTVLVDEKLFAAMDELREKFGKTSRAEIFRMAIALLKVAGEAQDRNQKLTIADTEGKIIKEIIFPA